MSDKEGNDQDGDGTEQKPFKTSLRVREISVVCFLVFSLLHHSTESQLISPVTTAM